MVEFWITTSECAGARRRAAAHAAAGCGAVLPRRWRCSPAPAARSRPRPRTPSPSGVRMAFDVDAVRAQFPALKSGSAHFDAPGGTQTPQPVIDALADALANPLANRGRTTEGERNAEAIVAGARRAMADLLGADPRGIVFGRSATQLTYDFSRTLAKTWSPGRRGRRHPARPRRQHPPLDPGRRAGRRHRALGRLRPGDRRADARAHCRRALRTHPARRRHRRLEPHRHPPRHPRDRRPAHEAGALLYVDGVHYTAHALVDLAGARRGLLRLLAVQVPRPAPAASWPAAPNCWRPCTRTSCCPPPTPSPSGSSWAPCRTSCSPGPDAAVDFLAGLDPGARRHPPRTADRRRRGARGPRGRPAGPHRPGAGRPRRRHRPLPGGRPHPDPAARPSTTTARPTPTGYLARARRRRSGRILLRASRPPAGSASATPAGCAIGLAPYTSDEDVDRLLDALSDFLGTSPVTD